MNLTASEERAVRYYEGDIPAADRSDPVRGDEKAYVSLNALLFPGLRSEMTRIAEGKRLNTALLAQPDTLLLLYRLLFSAAKKGAQPREMTGFRVERAGDFAACAAAGQTLAFTSTCLSGFLSAYGDKCGIVLLNYRVPAGTPCIIFSQMLSSYAKSAEDELLLPPFLRFDVRERPLTADERRITDLHGDPPQAASALLLTGGSVSMPKPSAEALTVCEAGIRVWTALNSGVPADALDPDDVSADLAWKEALRAAISAENGGMPQV